MNLHPPSKKVSSTVIDNAGAGAVVRRERRAANVTLQVLAYRMGISTTYLSLLEKGDGTWTADFWRLAKLGLEQGQPTLRCKS